MAKKEEVTIITVSEIFDNFCFFDNMCCSFTQYLSVVCSHDVKRCDPIGVRRITGGGGGIQAYGEVGNFSSIG